MSVDHKRETVKGAYSGDKWKQKVDSMPDDQVTAVYIRLKGQGKV